MAADDYSYFSRNRKARILKLPVAVTSSGNRGQSPAPLRWEGNDPCLRPALKLQHLSEALQNIPV